MPTIDGTIVGIPITLLIVWRLNRKRGRPVTSWIVISAASFGLEQCFADYRSDCLQLAAFDALVGLLVSYVAMTWIKAIKRSQVKRSGAVPTLKAKI